MDPLAFWLGYLYEQALTTELAFEFVREDIEAIHDRLQVLEHNEALRAVRLIMPQGNA